MNAVRMSACVNLNFQCPSNIEPYCNTCQFNITLKPSRVKRLQQYLFSILSKVHNRYFWAAWFSCMCISHDFYSNPSLLLLLCEGIVVLFLKIALILLQLLNHGVPHHYVLLTQIP